MKREMHGWALLCLLTGQALLSFLQVRGLGMELGTQRHNGMQFADDFEALLADHSQAPPFLAVWRSVHEHH
jgi:hypothetical protein